MPNLYKGFVFDGILFAAIRWAVVGAAKTAPTKKLSYYSCWTGFAVGQGGGLVIIFMLRSSIGIYTSKCRVI